MFLHRYNISSDNLWNIQWVLLLSCCLKEQRLDYRWEIFLEVSETGDIQIFLDTYKLPFSKDPANELDYVRHLTWKLKEQKDYECHKYQQWQTILDSKGSSFTEKGVLCIAMRCVTLEKLKPAQRFFAVPTDIPGTHTIDYFKRLDTESSYTSLDRKIVPLVKALNSLPCVATVSSCQAHYGGMNMIRNAFVSFIANIESVAEILEQVRALKPRLHFTWQMIGSLENGCPSTGPYIIWQLITREKVNLLKAKKLTGDINLLADGFLRS